MNSYSRTGFKWSVNEILSLQREFELLGWNVQEIADKHKRTPNAIMHKLDLEGFADYNVLYSDFYKMNAQNPVSSTQQLSVEVDDDATELDDDATELDDDATELDDHDEDYVDEEEEEDEDEDEDDEVENLSQRVDGLEEGIIEIRSMIQQMMQTFSKSSSSSKGWF